MTGSATFLIFQNHFFLFFTFFTFSPQISLICIQIFFSPFLKKKLKNYQKKIFQKIMPPPGFDPHTYRTARQYCTTTLRYAASVGNWYKFLHFIIDKILFQLTKPNQILSSLAPNSCGGQPQGMDVRWIQLCVPELSQVN